MRRSRQQGMSLVEIAVALAIVAIILAFAAPSMGNWIQNTYLRNSAESVLNGVQTARLEALKRNRPVAFRAADPYSTAWQVCVYDVIADLCSTASDAIIASKDAAESSQNTVLAMDTALSNTTTALTAGSGVPGITVFDSFGRLYTSPNPNVQRIDVRNTKAQDERRLVILINTGGQVRMCDPRLSKATNPQGCA
jgi:type IV fimbrial biogenesis protein FimT